MKLKIFKNTTVYIMTPANVSTGGPELLHQLAHKLRYELDIKSNIFYYGSQSGQNPVPKEYYNYRVPYVTEIEDKEENILIIPEVKTDVAFRYKHIRKIIWWLSVDNYYFSLPIIKSGVNKIISRFNNQYLFFDKRLRSIDHHWVQSFYAQQHLEKKGIHSYCYLSDFLNENFIRNSANTKFSKEDLVVYNPKKGYALTKKIIKHAPDIGFIPIKNMTRERVIELLKRAKVYIDFGHHPGKDRIPREAAIMGCCVIAGKRGACANNVDVPIPDEFKFAYPVKNVKSIVNKIKEILLNYYHEIEKFESYRVKIRQEEEKFMEDLKKIFH